MKKVSKKKNLAFHVPTPDLLKKKRDGVDSVSRESVRQDLQMSRTQTRVLTLPFPPTFTFLRNQPLPKYSGRLP